MTKKPKPRIGVVVETKPLTVVSRPKRFAIKSDPSFEVGAVAQQVRPRAFSGELVSFNAMDVVRIGGEG